MQILEGSVIGLRAARITFSSPAYPTKITLFPMVHIGEAGFYREVFRDAYNHDAVLVEGVSSPVVRRITRAYRWIASSSRLGLERQPAGPSPGDCRAEIVHADLSGPEFEAEWRKVPLGLRLFIRLLTPIASLHFRGTTTRQELAKRLAMEDYADHLVDWGPEGAALTRAILGARDERLIERMREQVLSNGVPPQRLAIVYGAGHMRAVVRELTGKLGFMPTESSWMTIFQP
jgi:hypothetical protein